MIAAGRIVQAFREKPRSMKQLVALSMIYSSSTQHVVLGRRRFLDKLRRRAKRMIDQ